MASWNKFMCIGNVGAQPEMRVTPQGKSVTSFSVAINRVSVDVNGNSKKETDWFRVKTWNRLAESCNQNLSKGKMVLVEGPIHTSYYEKDGVKRQAIEVTAERVVFLSPSEGKREPAEITTEQPPEEQEIF